MKNLLQQIIWLIILLASLYQYWQYGSESIWWKFASEMPQFFTSRQIVAEIWGISSLLSVTISCAVLTILQKDNK